MFWRAFVIKYLTDTVDNMMHADDLAQLDMSSADAKRAAYRELAQQTQALFAGERDWIANCAQFAALIYQQVPSLNWAGFYLNKNNELVLGPFQGKVACVRIPFNKGVCGACASTMQTQLVADVHAFPGHIACDGASNSEIVIPVIVNERLIAVFDIDSPLLARFDVNDQAGLEQCLNIMINATQWPELM